jgi:hypothetical protein
MYELFLTSFNCEKQDSGLHEFMHIYEIFLQALASKLEHTGIRFVLCSNTNSKRLKTNQNTNIDLPMKIQILKSTKSTTGHDKQTK